MWMVEDAIEGRTTLGKSRNGECNPEVLIRLTGKQHYQLQKFLQGASSNEENAYKVRMAVLLWEAVRTQVECFSNPPPPPERTDAP